LTFIISTPRFFAKENADFILKFVIGLACIVCPNARVFQTADGKLHGLNRAKLFIFRFPNLDFPGIEYFF
jgi:hypothetical protein